MLGIGMAMMVVILDATVVKKENLVDPDSGGRR
jgi:hypothetical protein